MNEIGKLTHRGIKQLVHPEHRRGRSQGRGLSPDFHDQNLSTFHWAETGQNPSSCLCFVPLPGAFDWSFRQGLKIAHEKDGCRDMHGIAAILVTAVISSSVFRTDGFPLVYNTYHNLGSLFLLGQKKDRNQIHSSITTTMWAPWPESPHSTFLL